MVKNLILFVLVIVVEGHMGQVHPKETGLGSLSDRADCIFVVEKASPFSKKIKIEVDDSKKYPAYESNREIFKVVQVIKNECSTAYLKGTIIEVREAYD